MAVQVLLGSGGSYRAGFATEAGTQGNAAPHSNVSYPECISAVVQFDRLRRMVSNVYAEALQGVC